MTGAAVIICGLTAAPCRGGDDNAPAPDDYAIQAFTSPYHVVTVPRDALGVPPTAWLLVDVDGRTLARRALG